MRIELSNIILKDSLEIRESSLHSACIIDYGLAIKYSSEGYVNEEWCDRICGTHGYTKPELIIP